MIDDRIANLERKVARLQTELTSAQRRVAALEAGPGHYRRTAWRARTSWLVGACALFTVAALGLGTASAAPKAQSLTVNQLRVVDGTGVVRALLNAQGLQIYDLHGQKVEAAVVTDPRLGGQVATYDLQGNKASTLGTDENGLPAVRVWSAKQPLPQAGLFLDADGLGRMQASGVLQIDGPQDSYARLGANDVNDLSLRFYQPDEDSTDMLASIGETAVGQSTSSGMVTINRVKGIPQLLLRGGDTGGTVATYDANGNQVATPTPGPTK